LIEIAGKHPNVLEIAYNFMPAASTPASTSAETVPSSMEGDVASSSPASSAWLRAYLPTVPFVAPDDLEAFIAAMADDSDDRPDEGVHDGNRGDSTSGSRGALATDAAGGDPEFAGIDRQQGLTCRQLQQQLLRRAAALLPNGPAAPSQGLALVATRAIRDGEEVLQNYRLNPHVPQVNGFRVGNGMPGKE
jgi:hypothetical protein